MTYFFILGNNPGLSIAEISQTFTFWFRLSASDPKPGKADIRKTDGWRILQTSKEVLILETADKIDPLLMQERLGGTIKIGKIISSPDINQIINLLPKRLRKIYFGFSIYKLSERADLRGLSQRIKDTALKIKKKLKERGISSRWVTSRQRFLSSVIVQKNGLLDKGAEFVFLANETKILFGRTLSCQAFEEYSIRDFSRPAKPIEKGMMPPKLAKIMINLAGAKQKAILLDPFCGAGTILQEAALLGYQKLIGADLSQKAIKATNQNLGWLKNKYKIENTEYEILQCDVRELNKKIAQNSVDAIVTEPYLGPLKIRDCQSEIKNLSKLYLSAFREFKKILKSNGRLVIIFPVFKIKKKHYFLPVLDGIKKTGWRIKIPVPDYLLKSSFIRVTDRRSIIYSRPGQKVLREIFIFSPG